MARAIQLVLLSVFLLYSGQPGAAQCDGKFFEILRGAYPQTLVQAIYHISI